MSSMEILFWGLVLAWHWRNRPWRVASKLPRAIHLIKEG